MLMTSSKRGLICVTANCLESNCGHPNKSEIRLRTQVANLRYRKNHLCSASRRLAPQRLSRRSAGACPPPLRSEPILQWNCLIGLFGPSLPKSRDEQSGCFLLECLRAAHRVGSRAREFRPQTQVANLRYRRESRLHPSCLSSSGRWQDSRNDKRQFLLPWLTPRATTAQSSRGIPLPPARRTRARCPTARRAGHRSCRHAA